MSAKIIQEGFRTAGFNKAGEYAEAEVAMVRAEIPGPNGEWMFVVIDGSFYWVKGLPSGKGYLKYKLPLSGGQSEWQAQIQRYAQEGPKDSLQSTFVPAGSKTALAQPNFYIVAE